MWTKQLLLPVIFYLKSSIPTAEKKSILFPTTFAVTKGIMKSLPQELPESHFSCPHFDFLTLSDVSKRYYDPDSIIIIIIITIIIINE